tara:strand:+ start:804 stop:1055 length:252 start_codon:yes stop_codon:yes gene_type:complete
MNDDNDNDKIIDISDYVSSSKTEEELELEDFTNKFVDIYNKGIIERQQRLAKERFTYLVINFLLFTQLMVIISIFIIFGKIYS